MDVMGILFFVCFLLPVFVTGILAIIKFLNK